ncbi:MAG: beta galactosidase jelly roll domain-containing protein [Kiritimatiellae bacterium]|nr:beta galactosidase jelly roll domain-containing protein [Kiritimatiellia bacterium]
MNRTHVATGVLLLLIPTLSARTAEQPGPGNSPSEVSQADSILCLFQDWGHAGYDLTPSEDLSLVFQNRSRSNGTVRFTVEYKLTDSQQRTVGRGSPQMSLAPRERKTLFMEQPANLAPGRLELRYRVKTEDGGEKAGDTVALIRRVQADSPLSLRVVQWTDCMDPEGYADMIVGTEFARHIENLRQWPKKGNPDVVVVKQLPTEDTTHPPRPATQQRAAMLKRYLAEGGAVLLVGPLPSAYDAFSPLQFQGESQTSARSHPLRILAKDHPLFARWGQVERVSRSYWPAKAKPGTAILAAWDDGRPALAEWRVGKGTVMHVTCGLGKEIVRGPEPSGGDELYLRCIYALAGRTGVDVAGVLRQAAGRRHTPAPWSKLPHAREGVSKNNFGGFGWNNDEGLMAVVDVGRQTFRSMASTAATFRMEPEIERSDVLPLPTAWRFSIDPDNAGTRLRYHLPEFDDAKWREIEAGVPMESQGVHHKGRVWYRTRLTIPADWRRKELVLRIGAIQDFDTTYFNGQAVGSTGRDTPEWWAKPRTYVLPSRIVRYGADNHIAVCIDALHGKGGLYQSPLCIMPKNAQPAAKRAAVDAVDWTRKRLDLGTHTITCNDAAPGVVHDFGASRLIWLDCSSTHMAWEQQHTVKTSRADGSARTEERTVVRGNDLSANWLALWQVAKDGKVRGPLELVLTRRPARVFLRKRRVGLSFPSGAGKIVALQPLGIEAPAPQRGEAWDEELPNRAAERCRFWAKAALARPASVKEAYVVSASRVRIENLFQFEILDNDWNLTPIRVATLPPVLPLARAAGLPVEIPRDAEDLSFASKCGPLMGCIGADRILYSLPIPNHDHQGLVADASETKWQSKLERFLKMGLPLTLATSFGREGYVEDLREMIYPGPTATNLFSRKLTTLGRAAFPTMLSLPAANEVTADLIRRELFTYSRQAVEFFQEKTVLRRRTEPFTGLSYSLFGIYPARIQDGVRMFQDQNEFSGIVLYCTWTYALYSGNWDLVRDNWSFVAHGMPGVLPHHNYWSMMASSASEDDSTVGFDMLHAEYPGWIALAGMARVLRDEDTRRHALYMATKSAVALAARFEMDGFLKTRAGLLDPKFAKPGRTLAFHEKKIHWTSENDKTFRYHIALYDTASGTPPEMMLFFGQYPPLREAVIAHERRVGEIVGTKTPLNIMNMYAYQMLGMPSPVRNSIAEDLDANLQALAQKYRSLYGWRALVQCSPIAKQIASNVPVVLIDWAPFAYACGQYDPATREARFVFTGAAPEAFTLCFASRLRIRRILANGHAVPERPDGHAPGFHPVPGGRTVVALGQQTRVELRVAFDPEPATDLHACFSNTQPAEDRQ